MCSAVHYVVGLDAMIYVALDAGWNYKKCSIASACACQKDSVTSSIEFEEASLEEEAKNSTRWHGLTIINWNESAERGRKVMSCYVSPASDLLRGLVNLLTSSSLIM